MTIPVHFVGSIALDTPDEVFATAGELLGPHLKRVPDGEPGGRRLWISWQIDFGIASECGISRGRHPSLAREFMRVYAGAAAAGPAAAPGA